MFTVSHGVAFGIASLPGPWIEKKYAGAHSAQHRMRSAKLKNHLNHKIVTTKVWDFKIRYQILVLLSKVFMSLFTRGPGRRDTCHLADFFQTFTVYKGH